MNEREQIEAAMRDALWAEFARYPQANANHTAGIALDAALAVRGDDGYPLILGLIAERVGWYCVGTHEHPSLCPDVPPSLRDIQGLSFDNNCASGVPVFVPRREQEDA